MVEVFYSHIPLSMHSRMQLRGTGAKAKIDPVATMLIQARVGKELKWEEPHHKVDTSILLQITSAMSDVYIDEVIPSCLCPWDFSRICFGWKLLQTEDCINIILLLIVFEHSPNQLP